MAKEVASILIVLVLAMTGSTNAAQPIRSLPVVNVAIVADGPSERVTKLRALFLQELRTINRGEFDIQAPANLQLEADRTLSGVHTILNQVLANSRVDMVITLGVLVSQDAATRARLPKPVVAPFITNHGLQDIPYKNGVSGKRNLSYVSLDVDIGRDLTAFRKIVPFRRLAFLIDSEIAKAIPDISNEVTRVARKLGIKITVVTGTNSAAAILAAVPKDTQSVYVGPLPALSDNEFQTLVAGLIDRRLPSFAFEGKSDVERGLLVGIAPAVQMNRLARRVALNVRRILLGEKAATLPVAFARTGGLTINMRTARAIGFAPSWKLLTRAELLHEEPEAPGPPLTLADAVQDALKLNLNLRITQTNVSAGKESIREARAALFPRIGLTGRSVNIDADDASVIPGRAERTTSGSLTLDQTLYSEPAWANLEIQKQLQVARVSNYEKVRLDLVLETTHAYLNVLRARTNLHVQKDNLRLSRSNLDLARARRRIGTAGPSEVYRWESEIANARRAVVFAQSQFRVAEITLNTLLHRPLEEAVHTVKINLDEPILISSQQRLFELIDNPESFRVLREFIVQDALAKLPELHQLDARILAQERSLKSAQNAYWQPKLSLRAERTETFSRDGALGPPLPGVDNTENTISLQLSFPLYTSGDRSARKSKAAEELRGLYLQRKAVTEQIEQRIRSALLTTRSAYTAIRLSRQAADAAENNYVVVRDAYSRGTVSILDLLDAQNASLVAGLRASTAVYDFIYALMDVERAAGRFDFFLTPQDQADWFNRVERFFAKRGVGLPQH